MDFIADVVAGRVALPTISRVVQRLIIDLRGNGASAGRLADLLAQDPVLAARTVRLANSPFYCGRRSLASIDEAVSVIGTDALRTLVLTCGVACAFVDVPTVNLRQFWQEAVVTATAARLLLSHSGCRDPALPDAAYTAGLLLETGHLILCQVWPEVARAHFNQYLNLRGAALADAETAAFGVAHPAVGALWVEALGFPTEIGEAIRDRFQPDSTTPALGAALHLAAQLAAAVQDGLPCAAALPLLDPVLCERLEIGDQLAAPAFGRDYARLQGLEWLG